MNTTDILKAVHRLYAGDTSYPESGDDDYDLRFAFVEDAINAWATRGSEENIDWKELFVSLADANDGDKEATSDTTSYTCPSDFVALSSKVKIGTTYYDVISPDKALLKQTTNSSDPFCWITGNEDVGYKINFNNPITGTINYDYYKQPTIPTVGTEIPEMKRPYFIVHFILARLYELDGRNDLVTFHEGKMTNLLNTMVIDNELVPFGNSDQVEDINGGGFGW